MTKTVELSEQEYQRLVTVLEKNEQAVGKMDGVRWEPAAASRIEQLRRNIQNQNQ